MKKRAGGSRSRPVLSCRLVILQHYSVLLLLLLYVNHMICIGSTTAAVQRAYHHENRNTNNKEARYRHSRSAAAAPPGPNPHLVHTRARHHHHRSRCILLAALKRHPGVEQMPLAACVRHSNSTLPVSDGQHGRERYTYITSSSR